MSQVAPSRFTVIVASELAAGCTFATLVVEALDPLAASERALAVAATLRGWTDHQVCAVLVGSGYDALHAFEPDRHLGLIHADRCSVGAYP